MNDELLEIYQRVYAEKVIEAALVKLNESLRCHADPANCPARHILERVYSYVKGEQSVAIQREIGLADMDLPRCQGCRDDR